MGLAVQTMVQVEHLNVRRSGRDDESIIAIDVKVSGEVAIRDMAPALGATPDDVVDSLYAETGAQGGGFEPRLGVAKITTYAEFENHRIKFGAAGASYGKLRKIELAPLMHLEVPTADVTMTVTLDNPSDPLVNSLVEHIKAPISLHVEPPPELDL